jgi:hypothetical protein
LFLLVPVQYTKIPLNVNTRNDEFIHPYVFFIWSVKESSVSGFNPVELNFLVRRDVPR